MKILLIILIFVGILATGCTTLVRFSSGGSSTGSPKNTSGENAGVKNGKILYGKASYYADIHNGRSTASGEIFDNDKMTAANQSLPFGTKVRVTNLKNHKQVDVVINDRGPFKGGRIIDISRAAAEQLDMIRDGVVDVEIEVLDTQ